MSTIPRVPVGQVRVTDAERAATDARLQRALARGSLTFDELDQRARAAYHARTQHELRALTADLPAEPAPDPCARQRPDVAARRAGRIQDLHALTACWLLASLLLLGIWGLACVLAGPTAPWPLWVIGPSGALLATAWLWASR